MNKLQRQRVPLYMSDANNCARQIVRESLADILAGTYQTPQLEDMILVLEKNFYHPYDEF